MNKHWKVFLIAFFLTLLLGVLVGCGALKPDYLTAAAVHQSQPMHGPYPAPVGDNDRSEETGFNGLQGGLLWEFGPHMFVETDITYAITNQHVVGGPWIFMAKAGVRFKL